jgi:aspartate/tyrosine/aromatic aminotransferase
LRLSLSPTAEQAGHRPVTLPSRALTPAPPDPILGLAEAFRSDPRPQRVNLAVGVYVDDSGTTPILNTVRQAEDRILERATTKSYRPIDGSPGFRNAVRDLVFATDHEVVTSGRSVTAQTPGGTGALRVGADFLIQTGAVRTIWLSEPTWPNHPQLFGLAGFETRTYPYLDGTGRRIDAERLLATLRSAERGDVVLLHGSCHNPSGVDPSPELWSQIGDVLAERDLLPFVDFAYQGFGDGLREDADWMAGLIRPGIELLIASSFSKNFALYNERVGALTIVANDQARASSALSHLKVSIRSNYSNPPAHGADIIETILGDATLRAAWEVELAGMRGRIHGNRNGFVDALQARGVPGDWEPLRRQRGMFALLGLTTDQVSRLRDEHAVYVVGRGRINVAGLTEANLATVVEALAAVIGNAPAG